MRATMSVAPRLFAAVLAAILLAPYVVGSDRAIAFDPADTERVRGPSDGGGSLAPQIHTRSPVNVRELAAREPTKAPGTGYVPLRRLPSPPQPVPSTPDPLVYTGPAPVQATITANPPAAQAGFAGLSYASGPATNLEPPDPWVAVGPNHLVQAVNTSLRFTDRSNSFPDDVSLLDFFGMSGEPIEYFTADPRVIYDAFHGRWIITELSWDCDTSGPALFGHGYIDVAISETSDPTGNWSGFYFYWDDVLPDYPALGTSTDKVALTANLFQMVGGGGNCVSNVGYIGSQVIVMDWTGILSPTTVPFDYYNSGTDCFTPRVAVQVPATSPQLRAVLQCDDGFGTLDVFYIEISGLVGSGGGTSHTEADLTVGNVIQAFTDPIAPRQPGGTIADAVDSRPTDAIWQANKLTFVSTQACTPTGDSEPRDCVRVSQLNTLTATPSLVQDFLVARVGADSYMGGIGHSANGGLFVVWTRSSATAGAYASSYGAYQLPGDAANSISTPEVLAAGQDTYDGTRWGDYVGVAQDPMDRSAVWQGNEFASSDGWWATFVSQLKTATVGATYVPLSPARLLDTRFGNGLSGKFFAMTPRSFQVAGLGGVPANAVGVTGNLTATNQSSGGFVFLGPDPLANPSSSTLNFPLGDTRANGVTVALGLDGTLSATFGYSGSTDLIFDVTGYFVADASGATYGPLAPDRLLDTRFGTGLTGKFFAMTPRTFQVAGIGDVPANAVGVTGNLTATNQSNAGFVFLGPDPEANPGSSTLNFPLGDTRANGVTVALSLTGSLSATFGYSGTTDLVFDVTGYFVPDASGAMYVPLAPARLLDSRVGNGVSGKFFAMTPLSFAVGGRGGVPPGVVGVTGNLTATNQSNAGFVFLGPDPVANPTSSTLNFPYGDTRANGVTVAVGPSPPLIPVRATTCSGGCLSATFGYTGSTDLIFDVTGYFFDD
jgi:hypothetical protein